LISYFGLFLPLIFIVSCFTLKNKKQMFTSLVVSLSFMLTFYLFTYINQIFEFINLSDEFKIKNLALYSESQTKLLMTLILSALLVFLVVFRRTVTKEISLWSYINVFFSVFLISLTVSTDNLFFFLISFEAFIWLNLLQFSISFEKNKFLYVVSYGSTALLFILTVFLGLLESIFLSEITYSISSIEKISLSFVAGSFYSTQTVFFIMFVLCLVLKMAILLKLLTMKIEALEDVSLSRLILLFLGVGAFSFSFIEQQKSLYDLACENYGVLLISLSVVLLFAFQLYHLKNTFKKWGTKNG